MDDFRRLVLKKFDKKSFRNLLILWKMEKFPNSPPEPDLFIPHSVQFSFTCCVPLVNRTIRFVNKLWYGLKKYSVKQNP